MNCKDAIGVLADFLEQSLSPELLAELERHLGDCAPCRAYLETYRKTVELTGRAGHVEMPAEMKSRLRSLLLDQLRSGGD
ncbi:MAG TPA: zf-HC2 domain-containing protein [Methylomirabilota bacterium]|jgi:anti-sigma factor RsiW